MKICPVGAKLFHADRRTDMTKLIVTFRNFAKAPRYWSQFLRFLLSAQLYCYYYYYYYYYYYHHHPCYRLYAGHLQLHTRNKPCF